jgi:formylglycine-generating enzyme required for sulfatase activity
MVDRSHIGRHLAPHSAAVEAGRLRLFAKAIGETRPEYIDEDAARAAGHPALPAPPTYAFCLDMEVPDPYAWMDEFGIDVARVLHGSQHLHYFAPIYAGDRLRPGHRLQGPALIEGEDMTVGKNSIGPGYYSTMGIPLVEGREFGLSDTAKSPKVAIINEAMVRRFFSGRSPVGSKFAFGSGDRTRPDIEIVGVVKDSKHSSVRGKGGPFVCLPYSQKRAPSDYAVITDSAGVPNEEIVIPPGAVRLGAGPGDIPFGWDNEFGPLSVNVEAFAIDSRNVTNEEFAEFVQAGGYSQRDWWSEADWHWLAEQGIQHPSFWERDGDAWSYRGMFERLPLPALWPVYVSQAEASAFARWRGRRLPTEAEYHRAAFAGADGPRQYPWGNDTPSAQYGVFDFNSWEPQPVGTHPRGVSAWGVEDLMGNGWEWTSTIFRPFPGFAASPCYPEYSADFFDESHYVMKGASPATARELLRPTFRNWFRPRYPFVYATFRCVREGV